MLESTTAMISEATAAAVSFPSTLWATLVTTFGTPVAVVVCVAVAIGLFYGLKTLYSWGKKRYNNWSKDRDTVKAAEAVLKQQAQQQVLLQPNV